jgi:Leucine-rich repeat (LRR) protein
MEVHNIAHSKTDSGIARLSSYLVSCISKLKTDMKTHTTLQKSCWIAFLIFTSLFLFSQEKVFIPDQHFRNFLNSEYPAFMDASGDSLIADLAATLTDTLNCSFLDISDLTGIGCFTNITALFCEFNTLSELPDLSSNGQLLELSCYYNDLIQLPDLTGNIKLRLLDCHENQLSSLPELSNCTELEFLDCSYNQITALPEITACMGLKELRCYRNNISELPELGNNSALEILFCSSNQLTSLPDISNNTKLTELRCDDNLLDSLPNLSANTALIFLDCGANSISKIPDLSSNTMLLSLSCAENEIEALPDLSINVLLTWLNCSDNNISVLPDLSENPNLYGLHCAENQLSHLPDLSINTHIELFTCYGNKLNFSDARVLRIIDQQTWEQLEYAPQNPFGEAQEINLQADETLNLYIASQDSATGYQWFKDGNAIEGATDTLLQIENVNSGNSGVYTCKSFGTALLSPPMRFGPGISEFVSMPFSVTVEGASELQNEGRLVSDIIVYPNPTNGLLSIQMDGYKLAEVYSLMGSLLFTTQENYIDFKGLAPGIYLLKVTDLKGKKYNLRIIHKTD